MTKPTMFVIAASVYVGAVAGQVQPPELPPNYADRLARLEQVYSVEPGNLEVLDALAGSYAMAGRYEESIRIVRQMLQLTNERQDLRIRLAKLYSWSGRPDRGLFELSLLPSPLDAETSEVRCQLVGASGKAAEAAECYHAFLERSDVKEERARAARLALARNLAWSGNMKAAIKAYRPYHAVAPDDRIAAIELARLLLYSARYGEAERVCDSLLKTRPNDPSVLALKSVALHWAGHRSRAALRLAEQAVSISPADPDSQIAKIYALRDLGSLDEAWRQFRLLRSTVNQSQQIPSGASYAAPYRYLEDTLPGISRSTIETPYSIYDDADGVRNRFSSLRIGIPLHDHRLRFDLSRYTSEAPTGSIFTANSTSTLSALTAQTGLDLRIAPATFISSSVGGYRDTLQSGLRPIGRFAILSEAADHWTIDASVSREFFTFTPKAIAAQLSYTSLRAKATYHVNARTALWAGMEQRYWSDSNRNIAADGGFQHIIRRSRLFTVDTGIQSHFEAFRRDMLLQSGYFSPNRYRRHEAFVGVHGEIGQRIQYDAKLAMGAQRLVLSVPFRRSSEVSSAVGVRVFRSLKLFTAYQWRDYSLLFNNGWYRQYTIQLGIQP